MCFERLLALLLETSWTPSPTGESVQFGFQCSRYKNEAFEQQFPSWPAKALPQDLLKDRIKTEPENTSR